MKLCIIASGDFFSTYGGGQVYVKNLVNSFIQQKELLNIRLTVVSFSSKFPTIAVEKKYKGIPLYEISPIGNLTKLLTIINPDLVHAHGEKLIVSNACFKLGIKCVITAHHGGLVCPAGTLLNTEDKICNIPAEYVHCIKCYLRNTPTGLCWYPILKHFRQHFFCRIGQSLKRLPFIPFLSPILETGLIVSEKLNEWHELKKKTTLFIAPSNSIAEALNRNGCPKDKIAIIPHGIPISESQTSNIYNTKSIKFYYVGRINYVKGIHIMLLAFHSINIPNIELHIIGGAGNKKELRYQNKLKRQYRKDSRIVWHGKIDYDKMNGFIKNYHCLIHPALYLEVFGLNISEALSQHKYVLASRCGGSEMQIHNENEGLLFPTNDAKALKNALLTFTAEPKASKASVIDIQRHITMLYNLYKAVYSTKVS